jgi:hypothetical protein
VNVMSFSDSCFKLVRMYCSIEYYVASFFMYSMNVHGQRDIQCYSGQFTIYSTRTYNYPLV